MMASTLVKYRVEISAAHISIKYDCSADSRRDAARKALEWYRREYPLSIVRSFTVFEEGSNHPALKLFGSTLE